MRLVIAVMCCVVLWLGGGTAEAAVVTWEASSGLTPDQTTQPWELGDTATPEDPILSGGVLTLGTSAIEENLFYIQSGDSIDMPSMLVIEATVRFVSGSSADASRAPAAINFTTSPGVGNYLFIDQDVIFTNSDGSTRGASAAVDTDEALHLYRIEVSGTATGSMIQIFQDGNLKLSGATFTDSTFNGTVPRVAFGEISILSTGTSEWTRVSHNAYALTAIPAPATATMFALFATPLLLRRRR